MFEDCLNEVKKMTDTKGCEISQCDNAKSFEPTFRSENYISTFSRFH